jgi:hypothetical protein
MKLRILTFKNNGKLRWDLRNFIHYLRIEITTEKKVTPSMWAFRAFIGTYFMALQIPIVSMDFSSFLIFAIKHFTSFER